MQHIKQQNKYQKEYKITTIVIKARRSAAVNTFSLFYRYMFLSEFSIAKNNKISPLP